MLILSDVVGFRFLIPWIAVIESRYLSSKPEMQGVQAHTQKFWFVKNPGKISENTEKSRKIWAQMFRHLCSHCVMNETEYRNTSEFDFFLLHNTHEDLFVWLPKNVLIIFEAQIFRVSLSKFGQKSFALPKFACLYT